MAEGGWRRFQGPGQQWAQHGGAYKGTDFRVSAHYGPSATMPRPAGGVAPPENWHPGAGTAILKAGWDAFKRGMQRQAQQSQQAGPDDGDDGPDDSDEGPPTLPSGGIRSAQAMPSMPTAYAPSGPTTAWPRVQGTAPPGAAAPPALTPTPLHPLVLPNKSRLASFGTGQVGRGIVQ